MMTETRHPRLLGSLLVACAATLGALGCWTDRAGSSAGSESQSSARTPDDERERPAEVETNRPLVERGSAARPGDTRRVWPASVREDRLRIRLGRVDIDPAPFEGSDDSRIPFRTELLPDTLGDLDRWHALTPDGPLELASESLSRREGTDGAVFFVHTASSNALSELSSWTLAGPVGWLDGEADYRPTDLTSVESMPEVGRVISKVADKPLESFTGYSPEYARLRGAFPAPHDQFVYISVAGAPSASACHLCGFAFADSDDQVTSVVEVETVGLGAVNSHVVALVDPDGDGVDGILDVPPAKGSRPRWIEFDDQGHPFAHPLAGGE